MPALSIIVPVYKVEPYLRKCLESILAQTFTDFELIIINDDSPDTCPRICEEYKRKDNRIIVLHQKNGGLAAARNAGLNIAKGKYLGFVDSDDYIAPEMYQTLISEMERTGSDLVICDNYRVSADSVVIQSWLPESRTFNRQEAMFYFLTDKIGSQAWNKLYKRELFDDIRFPVGRFYEDIATTFLYVHRCGNVVYTKVPLYCYTIRPESISYQFNPDRMHHIFMGFKERFQFAQAEYSPYADHSLKLMVEHGLLACYQAVAAGNDSVYRDVQTCFSRIRTKIVYSRTLPLKRKLQALCLSISGPVYCHIIKFLQHVRSNQRSPVARHPRS